MTNESKYKTAQERAEAFWKWNKTHYRDNFTAGQYVSDAFAWLDLEADEEKPLPCPFCGGRCEVRQSKSGESAWWVSCVQCGYRSNVNGEQSVIAAHNRVAKAAKESEAK